MQERDHLSVLSGGLLSLLLDLVPFETLQAALEHNRGVVRIFLELLKHRLGRHEHLRGAQGMA